MVFSKIDTLECRLLTTPVAHGRGLANAADHRVQDRHSSLRRQRDGERESGGDWPVLGRRDFGPHVKDPQKSVKGEGVVRIRITMRPEKASNWPTTNISHDNF